MAAFNPYLVDEIVTEAGVGNSFFGLISNTEADRSELHGYEVTLSGRLVMPELHPQPHQAEEEDLRSGNESND